MTSTVATRPVPPQPVPQLVLDVEPSPSGQPTGQPDPGDETGPRRPAHRIRKTRTQRAIRLASRVAAVAIVATIAVLVPVLLRVNHAYITTPSMYPTIKPGSMVFIQPERSYHVGEVIEFRANGLEWIHRLVGLRPNGSLITKGDNPQSTTDVFVPETRMHDVIGRVSITIPYVGFPELFVHQPQYALEWLRAELSLADKLELLGAAVVLGLVILVPGRASKRVSERAGSTTSSGSPGGTSSGATGMVAAPRRQSRA